MKDIDVITNYFLDIPSDVWLDEALYDIVQEHSYASLPPLSKRRKAVSHLPPLDSASFNRPLLSMVF